MTQPVSIIKSPWSIESALSSEQPYTSRHWNYERSWRYIIKSTYGIVEASYFEHLHDGTPVKTVIELPTSYGCQVGCAHCASGDIRAARRLDTDDLIQIRDLVISANNTVDNSVHRVLAFSGIGECSLNIDNVFAFCRHHTAQFRREEFIITTVGTKPSFITDVDAISYYIPVRWLQITLLHQSRDELIRVMGSGFRKFDFDNLLRAIARTRNIRIRLNFVVIDGFNAHDEIIHSLARRLVPLSDKIVMRVSQLNETSVSMKNGIKQPTSDQVMAARDIFLSYNIDAYAFMSTFNDNMNCGQLAWRYQTML